MRRSPLVAALAVIAAAVAASEASEAAAAAASQSGAAGDAEAASSPEAETQAATLLPDDCQDDPNVEFCSHWAQTGACETHKPYMKLHCWRSCGCGVSAAPSSSPKCTDRDQSGNCKFWKEQGECENNPGYMKMKCAASCNSCDWLDTSKRCPMPEGIEPSVPPGAMSETFERAVSLFPEYEPQVLSSDPWVVTFENFIKPDEIEALRHYGEGRFVRSTASGGRKDGEFVPLTSSIRTSHTTWCDFDECLQDPRVISLQERMSNVTRVPIENSEFIQLLRYEACPHKGHPDCQFYLRHHDTIPELANLPCGPRVYTFFLYLSDVEEGGGTRFDLGFTVQPKAGRAVLWPATFPDRPFEKDDRTHHEALPVFKGTKFAANFWLHQYDYVTPHKQGCTA